MSQQRQFNENFITDNQTQEQNIYQNRNCDSIYEDIQVDIINEKSYIDNCEKIEEQFLTQQNSQLLQNNENSSLCKQQKHQRNNSNFNVNKNKFSFERRSSLQGLYSLSNRILNEVQQDYSTLADYVKNINQQISIDKPKKIIKNNTILNHNVDDRNDYSQSPQQIENDIKTKDFPNQYVFNMIIETPDGKHQSINVYDGANIYDLSYQFCIENNMDINKYCNFIENRLQAALNHYNSFQTPKKDSFKKQETTQINQQINPSCQNYEGTYLSQKIEKNETSQITLDEYVDKISTKYKSNSQNLNNFSYSFDKDSHNCIYQIEQQKYQNQIDMGQDQIAQNKIIQNPQSQNKCQNQLFNQTINTQEQFFQQPKSQTYELDLSKINDQILKDDKNNNLYSQEIFNTCFKFDKQQNQLMNGQNAKNCQKVIIDNINSPREIISKAFNDFQDINLDKQVQSNYEKMQQLKQNIQKSLEQQYNIQQDFHKRQNSKSSQCQLQKSDNNNENTTPEKNINNSHEYSPFNYRKYINDSSLNYLNASPIPHQLNSYDILKSSDQLEPIVQNKQVIQDQILNQDNQMNQNKQINNNHHDSKSYQKINNQTSHSKKSQVYISTPIKGIVNNKCDQNKNKVEIDEINKQIIKQSGQKSCFDSQKLENTTDQIEQFEIKDFKDVKYLQVQTNQKNQNQIQYQQTNKQINNSQNSLKQTSNIASSKEDFNQIQIEYLENENKRNVNFEIDDKERCEKFNNLGQQNSLIQHQQQKEACNQITQIKDQRTIPIIINDKSSIQKSLNNSQFILIHDETQLNNLQKTQSQISQDKQDSDYKKQLNHKQTQIQQQQNVHTPQNIFSPSVQSILNSESKQNNIINSPQINNMYEQNKQFSEKPNYNQKNFDLQANQKYIEYDSIQRDQKQQIDSYRSNSSSYQQNISSFTPYTYREPRNEQGDMSSRSTNRNSICYSQFNQNIYPINQNQYSTNRNPISAQSSYRSLNQSSKQQQSQIKENEQNIPYTIQSARGQLCFSSQNKAHENDISTQRDAYSKQKTFQSSSHYQSKSQLDHQQENIDKIKYTIFNNIMQSNPSQINNDVKQVKLNLTPFLEYNKLQPQFQQNDINNKHSNKLNKFQQKQNEYSSSQQSSPLKLKNSSSSFLRSSQFDSQKNQNILPKYKVQDSSLQKSSSNSQRRYSVCQGNSIAENSIKKEKKNQNVYNDQNNIQNLNSQNQINSNRSINQTFSQRIFEIFSYLDSDSDGYISYDKIEIRQMNDLVLFIITPILIELYNIKRNVNIEEFSCAFLKLFFNLPQQQKEIISDVNVQITQIDTQQYQAYQQLEYFDLISPLYSTYIENKHIKQQQNQSYNQTNKEFVEFYINNFKSLGQETQNYLF